MTIPGNLRDLLATFDVLETFNRLPRADQDRFNHWISSSSNDDSYWRRVEAFVLALRVGPLQGTKPEGPAGDAEGVG